MLRHGIWKEYWIIKCLNLGISPKTYQGGKKKSKKKNF